MTTTTTIPNSDIVFRRDRDGRRALVFVHGFLDDQHVWAPVLAGLSAPGFETVQFDQAGFGDRTGATGAVTLDRFAADLSAVVDAIGKPFVLVGHSLGGHVALASQGAHALEADGILAIAANVWIAPRTVSRLTDKSAASSRSLGSSSPT